MNSYARFHGYKLKIKAIGKLENGGTKFRGESYLNNK